MCWKQPVAWSSPACTPLSPPDCIWQGNKVLEQTWQEKLTNAAIPHTHTHTQSNVFTQTKNPTYPHIRDGVHWKAKHYWASNSTMCTQSAKPVGTYLIYNTILKTHHQQKQLIQCLTRIVDNQVLTIETENGHWLWGLSITPLLWGGDSPERNQTKGSSEPD